MERRLKQIANKDTLKIMMLKQEETFRDQVHELHRIYSVQKLLMNNAKNAEINATQTLQTQAKCLVWNAETETDSYETCFNFLNQRHPSNKYLGKPAAVTVPEAADEESDLELTLATRGSCVPQQRQPKTKEELFTSESGSSFSSSSTEEAGIGKDGPKMSPWLFQLNLNLTS